MPLESGTQAHGPPPLKWYWFFAASCLSSFFSSKKKVLDKLSYAVCNDDDIRLCTIMVYIRLQRSPHSVGLVKNEDRVYSFYPSWYWISFLDWLFICASHVAWGLELRCTCRMIWIKCLQSEWREWVFKSCREWCVFTWAKRQIIWFFVIDFIDFLSIYWFFIAACLHFALWLYCAYPNTYTQPKKTTHFLGVSN